MRVAVHTDRTPVERLEVSAYSIPTATPEKDALHLCLACKGCKGDCPVNVDIATYKAEFLSHYHARRLTSGRHSKLCSSNRRAICGGRLTRRRGSPY